MTGTGKKPPRPQKPASGSTVGAARSANPQRPARTPEPDDEFVDFEIRNLLLMLWRRKMIIVGIILMGLSLATIAMSFIQPSYTARSLIMFQGNNQQNNVSQELQAISSFVRFDTALILSELEVLRSRTLAKAVVKHLNLMADPEFNERFRNVPANLVRHDDPEQKTFKTLNVYTQELEKLPEGTIERDFDTVVSRFIDRLKVRSVPGSLVMQVEFSSVNPIKAALIANTIADKYIEQRLESKFNATKKVTDWLDRRLAELRDQVRASEEAVQKYKAQKNITTGVRQTAVSTEQLSALNSQLVEAKTNKAEVEARLKQVKDLARNPEKIQTASEIVNSEHIQALKRHEMGLAATLADLETRYGPRHPKIITARNEITKARSELAAEMRNIAKSIESELVVAQARVDAMESGLGQIEGVRHEEDESMIELRELMRQAESDQLIYDTFLKTYKRSDNQEELQEPEAKVISYAVAPRSPSYPDKMLILGLACVISLFVGLIVSLLLEQLDNTFRSAGQLEKNLGFPCFALIPSVEGAQQKDVSEYVLKKPSSTVAESVRTLRMVLNLRGGTPEKRPQVVTITSSFPSEGKTTLSSWIGRLAAKSGERVIIIDADLRRPNIHRVLGQANDVSLVEYLTGKKKLDDVIQKDEQSGAHVIYGRSVPNSALDLVSSDRMAQLIVTLRENYDLIIIDSPACLAVSDARVLANLSDYLVYVVAWDATPREVVIGGVKQFSDMGIENLAFVLSNVDVKRHVRYGYGDTVYYYGRYKEYYAE